MRWLKSLKVVEFGRGKPVDNRDKPHHFGPNLASPYNRGTDSRVPGAEPK